MEALQAGLFGSQIGHAGAQLVEGEQVFLVGLHESGDGLGGACEVALEPGAL